MAAEGKSAVSFVYWISAVAVAANTRPAYRETKPPGNSENDEVAKAVRANGGCFLGSYSQFIHVTWGIH